MMIKVAEHEFDRTKASVYSVGVGILIGLYNTYFPPIEFTFTLGFFGWLVLAIIVVIILHESVHGVVAMIFGCKPIFGIRPPLVYVTFTRKIKREQFIAVTLAPLIVLDTAFGLLFVSELLKEFSYFCLIINTLGAVGDVWMTLKLLPYEKGAMVQDTKTGLEIWME